MKEKGKLKKVEKKYPPTEHPFMFCAFAAHVLAGGKEKDFFVVNVDVSLKLRTYNLSICVLAYNSLPKNQCDKTKIPPRDHPFKRSANFS